MSARVDAQALAWLSRGYSVAWVAARLGVSEGRVRAAAEREARRIERGRPPRRGEGADGRA